MLRYGSNSLQYLHRLIIFYLAVTYFFCNLPIAHVGLPGVVTVLIKFTRTPFNGLFAWQPGKEYNSQLTLMITDTQLIS